MQDIIRKQKGNFSYLQFNSLNMTGLVSHCFTTRLGGVSQPPYDSLNMALHVGDDPDKVRTNRTIACEALGIDPNELIAAVQVHGKRVQVVGSEHKGLGGMGYQTAIPDTDALVTNTPGVALSSYYADCVPILLLDPVKKAVGLAHAGWRGTVERIAGETVKTMVQSFGCRPDDMMAGIGPSIGACCYQVDLPVQQALAEAFSYWEQLLRPEQERWRLDLWETNRRVLLDEGLKPENITTSGLCTACHPDLFFSYRADQGKTGRMASLIMLK